MNANATPGADTDDPNYAAAGPGQGESDTDNQLTLDAETAGQLASCKPGDKKRVELVVTVNSVNPFSASVEEVTEIEDADTSDDDSGGGSSEQAPAVAKLKSKPTGETSGDGMSY